MRLSHAVRHSAIFSLVLLAGCQSTFRSPTAQAFRKAELDNPTTTPSTSLAATDAGLPRATGYRFASLGAGDRLGRQIYVNDVVLAARLQLNRPEVAPPVADPRLMQAGALVNVDD